MKQQDPSSFPSAEELWTANFQEVCERMAPMFARSETRQRAQTYLQGLLSPLERKNGWHLAEEAGESTPYAMQYLLDRAVWDAEHLRDVLREYVSATIGDTSGMLVIDETGFRKVWEQIGRGATTVQRHGRTPRKLPARRLFDLQHADWTHVAGPRIVFAQELDHRSRALSPSRCACWSALRHQTSSSDAHAVAHPGWRGEGRMGLRR